MTFIVYYQTQINSFADRPWTPAIPKVVRFSQSHFAVTAYTGTFV